jgi:pyridoxal 5'-phosphate synthase pdxT subunit
MTPLIGVLALQGGFEAHERVLGRLGARTRQIRVRGDLDGLDGLVIPGGESTTMTLGAEREGLVEPLSALVRGGLPVFGSCAGLIMLDRAHLGLMDILAARNAFGRQISSFEAELDVRGLDGGPLRGIFIRAPWIAEHGPGVEILAEVDGHPVAAREDTRLAVAFHSELGDDDRVHALFLQWARAHARAGGAAGGGGSARPASPESPPADGAERAPAGGAGTARPGGAVRSSASQL